MNIFDKVKQIENKKPLAAVAVALAGLFLGWNVLLRPMLDRIGRIDKSKTELSQKEALFRSISEQEKKLTDYQTQWPGVKDKSGLIAELNSLAEKSHFSLLSVVPEERGEVNENIQTMSLRIEAEDGYHTFGEFVSRIESLKYYVKVTHAEISSETALENPGKKAYKISLTISLLYPGKGFLT